MFEMIAMFALMGLMFSVIGLFGGADTKSVVSAVACVLVLVACYGAMTLQVSSAKSTIKDTCGVNTRVALIEYQKDVDLPLSTGDLNRVLEKHCKV